MDKNYLKAVERKLKKQGKSQGQIKSYIKNLINPAEEDRDQPEVTNPLPEEEDELSTGDID